LGTDTDFAVGYDDGANRFSFNGSIDEVAIWNRSLSENEILRLYDKGREKLLWANKSIPNGTTIEHNLTSMPLSVQKDMVLLMHFDNDSSKGENDTHVYDWTGMGNNGTAYVNNSDGTARGANASGRFGWAYEFDGDDWISAGSSSQLEMENEFTVTLWMKSKSSQPDYAALISKGESTANQDHNYICYYNSASDTDIRCSIGDETSYQATNSVTVSSQASPISQESKSCNSFMLN